MDSRTRMLVRPATAQPERIAVLLPSFAAGGVARSILNLLPELARRGLEVDLLLCSPKGPYQTLLPAGVRVVQLRPTSTFTGRLLALRADPGGIATLSRPILLPLAAPPMLRYLADLIRYLKEQQPAALLSAKAHANLVALWAKQLAEVSTRVVVSERSILSGEVARKKEGRKARWRHICPVVARTYPRADAILAISRAVADDLSACTALPRGEMHVVYNPVWNAAIETRASESVDHPWFAAGQPPVILGAGRLEVEKGFATLIRAFALVKAQRPARLLILGEGETRDELLALASELGVAGDVELPGFDTNPYKYMTRAAVFVLPSRYEGLGNALIEAMACGCPVVATKCRGGPQELLEWGRYGPLVAVDDHEAMGRAILDVLGSPPDRRVLREHGRSFSISRAADGYIGLLLPDKAPLAAAV